MRQPRALLLCALAGFGADRAHAAQAPVDADLLEFLGSIGEDDDWQDYLENKPVKVADRAAKDAKSPPAKTPDASSATAATSKEKDK